MNFSPAESQQIWIDHLARQPDALGFIGMGIGKTAACLYALNELLRDASSIGALVIAPLRVGNLTWPAEVKCWEQFRWMRVANLRTETGQRAFLNGTAHIYILNYESIHLLVSLVERRKGTLPYDVVIFDELTRAKNPGSKRINLYRRKVPRAERHWGLTGTPMPNSHLDLFAQVRLVDGGTRLGKVYEEFKRTYFYGSAQSFAPWKPKAGTTEALEKKIADITVTLKSSDWLNIPDTVIEDVEIEFTPELKDKYQTLEKELVIELRSKLGDAKTINVASSAALITKLLQFTSGEMYDEERVHHPIHNLKFDALRKIVEKEKQPILVATIYRHEQSRIREQFPEAKFFSDAKSIRDQELLIQAWNRGEIPLLAAHPASCSHGLNLQFGSSILLFFTLTYSRELYEQMIARLARRGQKEITKVYRLMVPGTVDDAVAEALANKTQNEQRLISALQMLESFRTTK